jgi:hypothetical protein
MRGQHDGGSGRFPRKLLWKKHRSLRFDLGPQIIRAGACRY